MPYYMKQVNDDGTETFVEVADSDLVVPEDVVRGHSAFKQVLDESVNRRKKIAELQRQATRLAEQEDGDDVEDEEATPTPAQTVDLDAISQKAAAAALLALETANKNRVAHETAIDEIMQANKLEDEETRTILLGLDPAVAKQVAGHYAKIQLRFDRDPGSNNDGYKIDRKKLAGSLGLDDDEK